MYEIFEHFIEVMFALSMFVNAILFFLQAVKIYKTKSAAGLSLITFSGFNIIQVFTILHAYIHRDYVLIFGFTLSLFISGIVTLLIFSYRNVK